MIKTSFRAGTALLATLTTIALAGSSGATMLVRALSLDEVAAEAACVVHATVTETHAGRDAHGLPATWTSLSVHECLKGDVASEHTFKQLGVRTPLTDGAMLQVPGMMALRPGQEIVLFLRDESPAGFTSPVGLAQGIYVVDRDGAGAHVPAADGATRSLGSFKETVARLVGSAR